MKEFATAWGAILLFAGAIIIIAPLNALFGAFAGWIVGLFWGDTIIQSLKALGLGADLTMWQLGATLGFVGSFLRTTVTTKSDL